MVAAGQRRVNRIGDAYPNGLDAKPPGETWSRPVKPRMLLPNKKDS
jgi:hypothetical protein